MPRIVLISGHICSGKTRLARNLAQQFGFIILKTSEVIRRELEKGGADRYSLQEAGDKWDQKSGGSWVLDAVKRVRVHSPGANVVVDAVRITGQVECVRRAFGAEVVHVHLFAPVEVLRKRFERRKEDGRETEKNITYEAANLNKTEQEVDSLAREADLAVNTHRSDPNDTFVRVAARIGLFAPPLERHVDVLVGGQYGSEGKGQIAAYLSRDYDVLMRVGGPNAGHSVRSISGEYVYHHLPSGSKDADAEVLIGPGAVIDLQGILKEIRECGLAPGRLYIDPQAMVITEEDRTEEARSVVRRISSTGTGTGNALIRKIRDRGAERTTLAKTYPELEHYIGASFDRLERAYSQRKKILLEGTQGSGLSLHHGQYPHVTSRDTNVAGCLAEAGISPTRVRRVIMVVRTYPIRVANPENNPDGTSGEIKQEISFERIAERAGLDATGVVKAEITSTTRRNRRVGEFDWEQFRRAAALNAPTDIALTFVDYIDARNREARRFEQLTAETLEFIEEVERVAHAPVSLISVRFDARSVIDRRDWSS